MKWIAMILAGAMLMGAGPATKPTTAPAEKRWIAKPDAPDPVKGLANAQKFLHDKRLQDAKSEIAAIELKIQEVKAREPGTLVRPPTGKPFRDTPETNYAVVKKLKQEVESLQAAMRSWRNKDDDLIVPELWLNKDAIGMCIADILPFKTVNSSACLATIAKQTVMVEDYSTDNVATSEPHPLVYKGAWWVTGTTTYQNKRGLTMTCYVIKPIDLDKWLEYTTPPE